MIAVAKTASYIISGLIFILWISYASAILEIKVLDPRLLHWVDHLFQIMVGTYILVRFIPFPLFSDESKQPILIQPWESRVMRAGGFFILSKHLLQLWAWWYKQSGMSFLF